MYSSLKWVRSTKTRQRECFLKGVQGKFIRIFCGVGFLCFTRKYDMKIQSYENTNAIYRYNVQIWYKVEYKIPKSIFEKIQIQNMKCLCWARKAPFWNALSPLFVFHWPNDALAATVEETRKAATHDCGQNIAFLLMGQTSNIIFWKYLFFLIFLTP